MNNWPYVVALLISTVAAFIVIAEAWQRRYAPGGMPLVALGGAIAFWSFPYAIHFMAGSDQSRYFWLMATYLGVLGVPTACLAFAVQYTHRGHWINTRTIILFAIEPVLTFLVICTEPFHHLFLGGQVPVGSILKGGPWFWGNAAYSYALILFSIVLLIIDGWRSTRSFRGQTVAVLAGALFPLAFNLAEFLGWKPLPNLDLTPMTFSITCLCFTIGLGRYRLLDIVPIARDALIERMEDGVLVLDRQNRVVDINRTALQMTGKTVQAVLGEPVDTVLASFKAIVQNDQDTFVTHQEMTIEGRSPLHLDLAITPLYDRKGQYSGRLVVARDITDRRHAEQAEREQRKLAEALRDTAAALNSSLSFSEVLDCLLDNVGQVVRHDLATFMLLDEHGVAHAACTRGYQECGIELFDKNLHLPVDEVPNFFAMVKTGQALVVPDTRTSETWVLVPGLEKVRSYVGAPVLVKGKAVGFLDLASLTPNDYTEEHAERLQAFADQAAVAIETARLFDETRQRAEQLAALLEIGLTVTSGQEMEAILLHLLEKCKSILPVEAFYIAIYEPETGMIHHPLFFDLGEFRQTPVRNIRNDPGLSGHVIQTRQTLYIPDTQAPDFVEKFQVIRAGGMPTRSYLGVPMIVGDQVVGVISIQSYQTHAYSTAQVHLLETIATQAATVIENGRLYNQACQEISQRKQAEQRYRALFEQSHDAVFILDFDGKILDANQRAVDLLGYCLEELHQMYARDITSEPFESDKMRARLVSGEHVPPYERVFRKKDGEEINVEITAELVRDAEGTPLHIQSVARDITERKHYEAGLQEANQRLRVQLDEIEKLEAQLREQAIRDPLTGLFNRRYLEETLTREFQRAKREGTGVCLIMIDIDGFKGFNDTYGHDTGDTLLRRLGELLRTTVRQSDISCRYGGEEFVIVMPGTSLEKGCERAERIRVAFEDLDIRHPGGRLSATLSLGVATYPQNGEKWEAVLRAADQAMYGAKGAGKNCTCTAK